MFGGRCYCGAVQVEASAAPLTVAYCHCSDCRRVSGAPVAAFAAFSPRGVRFSPPLGKGVSHAPGVRRWFCAACGSPLAATYDYLPEQIYVPIGLFDDPNVFAPERHSHWGRKVSWLHLKDDLPKADSSARERLNEAGS